MPKRSMSLKVFILRRTLQIIPLVFAVIILTFFLIRLAPGDPIYYIVGEMPSTPERIQELRESLGLTKPLHVQLLNYLVGVMQGDLGYSYKLGKPVLQLFLGRAMNTLLLSCASFAIAIPIGITLGVFSSKNFGTTKDYIITFFSVIGLSIPIFWLSQLIIMFFSLQLRWFPTMGMETFGSKLPKFLDVLYHLVLPASALSVLTIAVLTRFTRASMLEVLVQDYIITARSKGLDERTVIQRHALRNAILPVITYMGMRIGLILTGTVMTETVFAWPGLGRLLFDSIVSLDYPMILGMFIIISTVVIIITLLVDILYVFVDPRIRYG